MSTRPNRRSRRAAMKTKPPQPVGPQMTPEQFHEAKAAQAKAFLYQRVKLAYDMAVEAEKIADSMDISYERVDEFTARKEALGLYLLDLTKELLDPIQQAIQSQGRPSSPESAGEEELLSSEGAAVPSDTPSTGDVEWPDEFTN